MNPPHVRLVRAHVALLLVIVTGVSASSDSLDETILALMAKRKIHGLSLAVIQDGTIVKAKGYGWTDSSRATPITIETLFQAGSISKPVAALGALRLVEAGKLSLDDDVNRSLKSWRVPDNGFTATEKVTVRRLLSHSAGLTVHGFPGYAVAKPIPTLLQILDGDETANTAAIRVDVEPGSRWRYSGGGYTVLQQLMIDVTARPFPEFMRSTVLEPLGMSASTYEQPLPAKLAPLTAHGYTTPRRPVAGRWHIYPEMAAAGLWTTAGDLARFAIAVQDAAAGRGKAILSTALAREMLTRQKDNAGLGLFLSGNEATERFEHGGRDAGFDARLVAYRETRQGAAVMINANDNSGMLARVIEAVADAYQWRGYPRYKPAPAIADEEPEVTAQLKLIFEQARTGAINQALYTPELAKAISASLAEEDGVRADLNEFGALKRIEILARTEERGLRQYRYRFACENEVVLVHCAYNAEGKIARLMFHPE